MKLFIAIFAALLECFAFAGGFAFAVLMTIALLADDAHITFTNKDKQNATIQH